MQFPHPDLDALSLDALSEREREEALTHLERCADCSTGYSANLEALAGLASQLPGSEPSAALRERLLVLATPQLGAGPAFDLGTSATTPHADPSQAGGRKARSSRILRFRDWLAPIAAALALAALAWSIFLQSELQRLSAENQQLQARGQRYERVLTVLSARGFEIRSLGDDTDRGTWGRVFYDRQSGAGMLMVQDLPPPGEGRTYQVWLVRNGQRVSAGLFRSQDSGWGYVLLQSETPIGEFDGLGITEEPAGGSSGPTGPRLLHARFGEL